MDGSSQTVGDICNLNTFSFQGWSWKENKFNFFFLTMEEPTFIVSLFQSLVQQNLEKLPSLVADLQSTETDSAHPSFPHTHSGLLPLIFLCFDMC